MTLWLASLLLLSLLVIQGSPVKGEEESSSTGEAQELNHDPSYPEEGDYYQPANKPTHYGGPGGPGRYRGYRGGRGYGYPWRRGYGRDYHYIGYHEPEERPDELDELYARLDVIQSLLKTESEALGSLEARLSLEKKTLDQFRIVDLPAAQTVDDNQDNDLQRLQAELDDLGQQLTALENMLDTIETTNAGAMAAQESSQTTLAAEVSEETRQDGQIAALQAAADNLKEKLFAVMNNQFADMDNNITGGKEYLDIVKDKENDRMCEVGQVTLDANDRKAEYLYQTSFQYVPQVVYSICGYNFDLDTLKDPKYGYGGYGGHHKSPNTMGVTVTGLVSSKTGVTFEAFDLSFGDSALLTVDVCFQACSIGPGSNLASSGRFFSLYTTYG